MAEYSFLKTFTCISNVIFVNFCTAIISNFFLAKQPHSAYLSHITVRPWGVHCNFYLKFCKRVFSPNRPYRPSLSQNENRPSFGGGSTVDSPYLGQPFKYLECYHITRRNFLRATWSWRMPQILFFRANWDFRNFWVLVSFWGIFNFRWF